MGSGSGWRCKSCAAGEEYWTGCGMMSCNVGETRARISSGDLGKIAAQLLSEEFPLDVNTVDERAFFRCPGCDKLVEGMSVRFYVADDSYELVLHVPPEKCPACDEEFCCTEERTPVSDGEIYARVESVLQSGCPECGSKDIEPIMVMWD